LCAELEGDVGELQALLSARQQEVSTWGAVVVGIQTSQPARHRGQSDDLKFGDKVGGHIWSAAGVDELVPEKEM
jgi:hypothetical protein